MERVLKRRLHKRLIFRPSSQENITFNLKNQTRSYYAVDVPLNSNSYKQTSYGLLQHNYGQLWCQFLISKNILFHNLICQEHFQLYDYIYSLFLSKKQYNKRFFKWVYFFCNYLISARLSPFNRVNVLKTCCQIHRSMRETSLGRLFMTAFYLLQKRHKNVVISLRLNELAMLILKLKWLFLP